MSESILEEVQQLAENLCEQLGLDLVHIAVKRVNQVTNIDALTDRPRGGITIEECSRLNRLLCDEVDARELFPAGYTVRVSSPGVDRPLRHERDFLRVIGRPVRFYLSQKVAGKLEQVGLVETADADRVMISQNSESLTIPMELINKAIQEI